ncbi:unnamed protein product [Zymoseptoria tritici ST99CH_3D7]|uniref:Protein kinase domain-containing protein n=1 Tax=Zymoseptoria tritici (strain ST99CH_3D7) TaxID=1276538 RepID=A0A1X7S9U2_ZYMT9|nr:unnamed protein product [Zymoseptoria tritici ST99CH_3D7]
MGSDVIRRRLDPSSSYSSTDTIYHRTDHRTGRLIVSFLTTGRSTGNLRSLAPCAHGSAPALNIPRRSQPAWSWISTPTPTPPLAAASVHQLPIRNLPDRFCDPPPPIVTEPSGVNYATGPALGRGSFAICHRAERYDGSRPTGQIVASKIVKTKMEPAKLAQMTEVRHGTPNTQQCLRSLSRLLLRLYGFASDS